MSVLSGYKKFKRYVLTDEGYQLCSQWTSSNTIHFDDGKTAETKLGVINGITDSLTATSPNIALSSAAGSNLQSQINELNTGIAYQDITDQISIDIPGSKYAYVEHGLVHVTLIANSINDGVKNIIIPHRYAPRIVVCGSVSYVGLSSDAGKVIAAYIMSDGTGALQVLGDIGTIYVTFIWPLSVH